MEFFFLHRLHPKGNIYPKIQGRLSKSAANFPNLNFGLLPPWGFCNPFCRGGRSINLPLFLPLYKGHLSTTARPLKRVPIAKITSRKRTVN